MCTVRGASLDSAHGEDTEDSSKSSLQATLEKGCSKQLLIENSKDSFLKSLSPILPGGIIGHS